MNTVACDAWHFVSVSLTHVEALSRRAVSGFIDGGPSLATRPRGPPTCGARGASRPELLSSSAHVARHMPVDLHGERHTGQAAARAGSVGSGPKPGSSLSNQPGWPLTNGSVDRSQRSFKLPGHRHTPLCSPYGPLSSLGTRTFGAGSANRAI